MEATVLQSVTDARPHADPLAVGALCTRWSERAFGGGTRTLLPELEVACFTAH